MGNPWVTDWEPETEPEIDLTAPADEDTTPTGATGTIPGMRPPAWEDQLDGYAVEHSRTGGTYWWMGAHGGAGEATMAALDPNGAAAGHAWPLHPAGSHVVVVARETAKGLQAATNARKHHASGELPDITILGLVTIAAAPGRTPADITRRLRLLEKAYPRHRRIPWRADLITTPDPTEIDVDRTTTSVLKYFHKTSQKEQPTP